MSSLTEKSFAERMYELLPAIYKKADLAVRPNPEPLRRYLQIPAVALDSVAENVEEIEMLRNLDFTPSKYLDPMGRMFGFNFPDGTTDEEKRRIIKNLPDLYKMKGNSRVFEMIARLIFSKDAKTSTDWDYSRGSSTNFHVNLEVGDKMVDGIDSKMERFNQLIEMFRPVNVGVLWTMLVFYDYTVDMSAEESVEVIKMLINDNINQFGKDTALLNSNRTVGDNFILYGGKNLPETWYINNSDDSTAIDSFVFVPFNDNADMNVVEDNDAMNISIAVQNENVEIYPLDNETADRLVDYNRMLNFGIIGDTIELNALPTITTIGG